MSSRDRRYGNGMRHLEAALQQVVASMAAESNGRSGGWGSGGTLGPKPKGMPKPTSKAAGKPAPKNASGKSKKLPAQAHTTFFCACCDMDITGEKSYLQHCQGERHRKASGGKLLAGLKPNKWGIIPELSPSIKKELLKGPQPKGSSGSKSQKNGGAAKKDEEQIQKLGMCSKSVDVLRNALKDSVGLLKRSPAASSKMEDDKEETDDDRDDDDDHWESRNGRASNGWKDDKAWESRNGHAKNGWNDEKAWESRNGHANNGWNKRDWQNSSGGSWRSDRGQEWNGDGNWKSSSSSSSQSRSRRRAFVPPVAHGAPHLRRVRESLPVLSHRAEILKGIQENQVLIVEGETGCGKTTQVAQYIIEDAAERGVPCSVVCTQPRRISAISVSERVAEERGERLGGTVGYSVRLDSVTSSHTALLFCTTGILLRRLEMDQELEGTTHVVVDEVHERGVESDFLLLALRDLLKNRRPDIKVILMSATMDKELFGNYFGGAPGLTIPGRTFPVETFFLEDALRATGHVLNPEAEWAIGGGKGKGKGKSKDVDSTGREDEDARKREDLAAFAVQQRYASYGRQVQAVLRGMEQDEVNYDLLLQLLLGNTLRGMDGKGRWDDNGGNASTEGASERPTGVLVFLSGAKEIETIQDMLVKSEEFDDPVRREWVMPLHGGLPPDDQKRVFQHPPAGVRKIVLATNVAETAITIDDVGYVVDTGRMKEMRYDAIRRMSSLQDTVVSRTNARQRRGRAGRVAPGLAVHMGLTRYRHDRLVDDHQPPEVRRVPLEQLVLRIHAAGLHNRDESGKAASICKRLIEPPNPEFVTKAVEQLVRLGAITLDARTGKESLTTLGTHLANLPLEAQLGKLVLFGAAFGPTATDAALTVAAALTSRNPFLAPLEERENAHKAKRKFADMMVCGPVGLSDHLAVIAAYKEWDKLSRYGDERYMFCRENFLSIRTLQGMSELKRSLLETLSDSGFVARGLKARNVEWTGRRGNGSDGVLLALAPEGCEDNCPPALVAALLCSALFPQVATAMMPQVDAPKSKKAKQNAAELHNAPKPKIMIRDASTGEPVRVKLHPGSVAAQENKFTSPYLVYQDLVNTSQLYLRDVTPVPPLALALFGASLTAESKLQGSEAVLMVDGWIKLSVRIGLKGLLMETRRRLDTLLSNWVGSRDAESHRSLVEAGGPQLLQAVVELLNIQEEVAPPQVEKKQSGGGGGGGSGGGGGKQWGSKKFGQAASVWKPSSSTLKRKR